MYGLPILTCLLRIFLIVTVFNFDTPNYYVINSKEKEAK